MIGKAWIKPAKKITLPEFSYTGTWEWIEQEPKQWSVKFTSSGTLTVTNWGGVSAIEICGTGGGGGGGGGRAFGSGYGGYGKAGGSGGNGYYKFTTDMKVSNELTYTITIGAGGGGGGGGYSSGTSGSGKAGGSTSFAQDSTSLFITSGGSGGGGASSANYTAGSGAGGTAAICFDNELYPKVNQSGCPGQGGGGGYGAANLYGDAVSYSGGSGRAGIIVIRNKRK